MTLRSCAFTAPFLPARHSIAPTVRFHPAPARICRPLCVDAGPAAAAAKSPRAKAAAKPARMPAVIRSVVPSGDLLQFVEDKAQPRSAILKVLSSYVKEHKLQDPANKRIVRCDAKLKKLFGVDECTILQMNKYISPHVMKPEVVGGRYLEEANRAEREYLKKKAEEDARLAESGVPVAKKKKKRASTAVSDIATKDMKAGRKLFQPVILSPELTAICRKDEMKRQDIVRAVWEYIRLNNLQSGPGQPIKCDFLMRKVFESDEIEVRTIMKGIGKHVTNKPAA